MFDECEERAEDVELLRDEVRQMQETEVQVFVDTLKMQQSLMVLLPQVTPHLKNLARAYLIHLRNVIRGAVRHLRNLIRGDNVVRGNIRAIRRKGVKGTVRGALRRLSNLYRRLEARNP